MLLWTGSALVCLYCTNPNAAPSRQITSPPYISAAPLTPPKPSNLTVSKGGIWMAPSLAWAPVAAKRVMNPTTIQNQYLLFLINLRRATMQNRARDCQYFFEQTLHILRFFQYSNAFVSSEARRNRSVMARASGSVLHFFRRNRGEKSED